MRGTILTPRRLMLLCTLAASVLRAGIVVAESQWDGIVGARGLYSLPDKWFIPYSVNAGTGESDFTWSAQAGIGYKFSDMSAVLGWRYLDYDVGSGNIMKELTLNGPFAGAVFHW